MGLLSKLFGKKKTEDTMITADQAREQRKATLDGIWTKERIEKEYEAIIKETNEKIKEAAKEAHVNFSVIYGTCYYTLIANVKRIREYYEKLGYTVEEYYNNKGGIDYIFIRWDNANNIRRSNRESI